MTPWPARRKADSSKTGHFQPINGLLGHYDGDWYDNPETGGGVRMHMGEMCLINQASSSQLEWILNTYNPGRNIKGQQLKDAAISFREGLLDYMHESDHYKEFIVPFGRTYRGLMINQVRDKGWFQWISSSPKPQLKISRKKYRIFFTAVQLWLDNPRKQEQIRDVGERLSKTEYEDDLDLRRDDEEESDDADEESDDDSRIDHDTDDEESEEWREDEDEIENGDTLLDEDSDSEMMSLDGNIDFTSHFSKTNCRLFNDSGASSYTPTKRLRTLSDTELSTSDYTKSIESFSVQYDDDDDAYSEVDGKEQDITPKRHHTRSGQRFNFSSSNESLVEDASAYKKVLGNTKRLERQSSVVSSESKEQQSQKGSPSPRNHPRKRRRMTIVSATEDETNDSDPEESIPLGVQFAFLRTPEGQQRKFTEKNQRFDSEDEVTLAAQLDDIRTPQRQQRKTAEKDEEDSTSEDGIKLGVRLDEMRKTSPRKTPLKVGPPWAEYFRRKALGLSLSHTTS